MVGWWIGIALGLLVVLTVLWTVFSALQARKTKGSSTAEQRIRVSDKVLRALVSLPQVSLFWLSAEDYPSSFGLFRIASSVTVSKMQAPPNQATLPMRT